MIIGQAAYDLLLLAADGWSTHATAFSGVRDAAAVAGAGSVWLGLLRYIRSRRPER